MQCESISCMTEAGHDQRTKTSEDSFNNETDDSHFQTVKLIDAIMQCYSLFKLVL